MKLELTEKSENTVIETQKSQIIRLADVFLIAPYLIYLSTKQKISSTDKTLLITLGLATLVYNGANYLKNRK